MHDVRVVLAREDIFRATHIGRELIHLVKAAIDDLPADILIAQIPDDKVVGSRVGKLGIFEIDRSRPKALTLQSANQMRTNEAAAAKHQSSTHPYSPIGAQFNAMNGL